MVDRKLIITITLVFLIAVSTATTIFTHWYAEHASTRSTAHSNATYTVQSHPDVKEILYAEVHNGEPNQHVFLTTDQSDTLRWAFVINDRLNNFLPAEQGVPLNNVVKMAEQYYAVDRFSELYQVIPILNKEELSGISITTNPEYLWLVKGLSIYSDWQIVYLNYYTGELIWSYKIDS